MKRECCCCKKLSNVLFPKNQKIFIPEASDDTCKTFILLELHLCRECYTSSLEQPDTVPFTAEAYDGLGLA